MATAPVKSQPLHNFSLPFLKWGGKNHTNSNHRFRRPLSADSSSSQPPPHADHASEPDSEPDARPHRVGSRTSRNRFAFSSCYLADKSHNKQQHHHHHHQQQQQQQQQLPSERAGNNETDDDGGERKRDDAEAEAEETAVQKPWNLRPRKPAFPRGGAAEIGAGNGEAGAAVTGGPSEPKSLRLRGMAEMQQQGSGDRKEKRKFWIALSREEIEEDIFVMTGSRPARRPRKRPKHVQKQLDIVFPGLWLVGATADAYRVADAPAKR